MKRILGYVFLLASALIPFMTSCSSETTEPKVPARIAFSPDSGPPGTVITITGVNLDSVGPGALSVKVDGETAPAVVGESGNILTGIPLFLDDTGAVDPPASPVDLTLYDGDRVLFEAKNALTVTELIEAPGTTDELVAGLFAIEAILRDVTRAMATEPGVREQYILAYTDALDSLLIGDSDHSLATAHAALRSDPQSLAIMDAVFSHTETLATVERYLSLLQSVSGELQAIQTEPGKSPSVLDVSDVTLAGLMQYYVILSDFGKEVVAESALRIGVVAGLLGIASSHPYVVAVAIITKYFDFVMNKIGVGLFPADLVRIDLQMLESEIPNGATTSSDIVLHAANRPPNITILDLTDQVLSALGLTGATTNNLFRTKLLQIGQFFLGLMSSKIQQYAQQHPELGLDPALFSLVPALSWRAPAINPVLLDCETFTPQILTPLEDRLEWLASDTIRGTGRVYVRPSTSEDSHLFNDSFGYVYSAGAFGENMTTSPTVSVVVGDELVLELVLATAIVRGTSQPLEVRAGYGQADGSIDYAPGINLTLAAEGGSLGATSGVTDSAGRFVTAIAADDQTSSSIRLFVSATGRPGEYAEDSVTIPVQAWSGIVAYLGDGNAGRIIEAYPWPNEHQVVHESPAQIPYLNQNDGPPEVNCLRESEIRLLPDEERQYVYAYAGADLDITCTTTGWTAAFALTNHAQSPPEYILEASNEMRCAFRIYNGSSSGNRAVLAWTVSARAVSTVDNLGYAQDTVDARLGRTDCSSTEMNLWELSSVRDSDQSGRSYAGSDTFTVAPGASEICLTAGGFTRSYGSGTGGASANVSIQYTLELLQ